MKRFLIAFGFACISSASAEEPQKLLDALRAELKAEIAALPKKASPEEKQRNFQMESMLSQTLPEGERISIEEQPQLLTTLRQLQVYSHSKKVDELCVALIAELRERSAKAAKDLQETFATTVHDALTKGFDAQSAKDLDAPLAALGSLKKLVQVQEYRSQGRQSYSGVLQAAEQTLTSFQDALIAAADPKTPRNRNTTSPAETLRQMASAHGTTLAEVMPRSEYLEKVKAAVLKVSGQDEAPLSQLAFEKRTDDLVRSVKKLEDMDAVMTKIESLMTQQRSVGGYSGEPNTLGQFRTYLHNYNDLRSGMATSLNFSSSYSNSGTQALVGVKNLLIRFALQRILQTPADLAQKDDENTPEFLQRVLASARSTSDWALVSRVLDAAQSLNLSTVASYNDTSALRTFLGGMNQEKAHYPSGAVSAYLTALKSGSLVIPVDYIGERLAAIRKEFPQEYEAGLHPTTSPSPLSPASADRFGRPFPPSGSYRSSSGSTGLTVPAENKKAFDPEARPKQPANAPKPKPTPAPAPTEKQKP